MGSIAKRLVFRAPTSTPVVLFSSLEFDDVGGSLSDDGVFSVWHWVPTLTIYQLIYRADQRPFHLFPGFVIKQFLDNGKCEIHSCTRAS